MIVKPKAVELGDSISITWEDGQKSVYSYKYLRGECPCAACVDEMSGRRTLDKSKIPESIRAFDYMEVGHYGMQFAWDDGHFTGIYSYELLRKLEAGS